MTPDEIMKDDEPGTWLKVTGTITQARGSLRLHIDLDPGVLPESFTKAYGDSYEQVRREGALKRFFLGATRPLQPGDRIEGLVKDRSDLHQPPLPGLADLRKEKQVYVDYVTPLPR